MLKFKRTLGLTFLISQPELLWIRGKGFALVLGKW
jgi:hypothetical protein